MGNNTGNNPLPTMGEDVTGNIFSAEMNEQPFSSDELNNISDDEYTNDMSNYILGKLVDGMAPDREYTEEELDSFIYDNRLGDAITEAYRSDEAEAEFGPYFEESGYIDEMVESSVSDSIKALTNKGFLIETDNGYTLNPRAYNTDLPVQSYENTYYEDKVFEDIYAYGVK